ncbi:serine hydrolase [Phenylobacterium hankyongense]|uniref:Serine hydrolase n=1 Tax=Phenylobacterium hankyongense TaxID=1813876 RepID=A0A328AU29_9CAUL|nr:serine hydrolase domain-containing protein [Phenylobacterium hankyongense]RAK58652.1 serine hydrolase [Phenylobacterium hankyongense]
MRFTVPAAVAALAMMFAAPLAADAQDAAAPPAAELPKAPVPYTVLHLKPPAPKPRPPGAPTATPATAPAARSGPAVAGAVPIAAAPAVPGARLTPGQPLPPGELEAFVDGVVRDAMAHEHIAGVTVSVVQNGQVVLKKGYGFASLRPQRPVDPDRTLFRVGSISKTFTWITLMKEVEAGRVRLDQPINLYLPEKVQVKDQGYDQPVRVVNLMDHSAGFEDRILGQLFEDDFERVRPLDLYLRQERPRRVHAPGAVSSYSNYGAGLAGEAVSYTSGKPFERLVEDEIFVPLGMNHTTFREPRPAKAGLPAPMPAALAADVSAPLHWTRTGFQQRSYEYIGQIAPAGAASSTAGDMARYMITLLNGGQLNGVTVFGPRTAEAFRTPLRRTPAGINGWAHGFMTFDVAGGFRGYGHSGATIDFHSNMVTIPQLNLGVFIAANSETGEALVGRFPERLVQEFYAAPQSFPRPGSPELAADGQALTGYFLTTRRAYSGLEGFITSLMGGTAVSVTPQGWLLTEGPRSGVRTWAPEGPASDRRFIAVDGDQRMAFTLGEGRARGFLPASNVALMERAPAWRKPSTLAILAALTAAAALVTLVGVALRNRREFRENAVQSRAALLQNIQAGLWLGALALFAVWASKSSDLAQVIYGWPGALLITASACALVAAALTIATLVALPAVWRGGRRVDSWTHLRKAFFTVTVLIYAGFSVTLAMWGALSPWSG